MSLAQREMRRTAGRISAAIIGMLFIWAALEKANEPDALFESIGSILRSSIPYFWAMAAVGSLIVVELTLGAWLLSGWRLRLGSLLASVILFLFSGALVRLVLDPTAPPCGCFGGSKAIGADAQTMNTLALGRNILMLATCVWVALVHGVARKLPTEPHADLASPPPRAA